MPPPRYGRPQAPQMPVAPEPAPPAPPVGWRQRARALRERSRNALWVGLGVVIALIALFIYGAYGPAETRLNKGDVATLVARAMASATPPPSYASRVYDLVAPSLVEIEVTKPGDMGKVENDSGSGVILDENGTILTSLHVVTQATDIQVLFFDDTRSRAVVVAQDPHNDIAVLRPRRLPSQVVPATLGNPATLRVGDEAIVLGNPFGIRHTLTAGVISGLERKYESAKTGETMSRLIQFDAAVNPGNSGGPLLNRNGEVVGIVTALLNPNDEKVFIGIGFAVPIDTAAAAGGPPPF